MPTSVAASGPALYGITSTGFIATTEGIGIGITTGLVNGYPTHNTFDSFDTAFTVMETYGLLGPVVSIGLLGGTIVGDDIVTGDPIPEPATVALLGIGLVGLAGAEVRRRRKKKAVD